MSVALKFSEQVFGCSCLWFLDAVMNNPCLVPDYRNDDLAIYLAQFKELSYYNDPYYGECYLLQHLVSGDLVVIRKESHDSEVTFNMSLQRNAQMRSMRNSHIVNLLGTLKSESEVDGKVDEGFFYDSHKISLVYEYIFVDLEKEIDNRLLENRPYDEQELMLIMTRNQRVIKSASTDYTTWKIGGFRILPSVPGTCTSAETIR